MKAGRNKTIDLSVEEGKSYLDRCISISKPTDLQSVINKTILGDTFSILPLLPTKFVDLLIADPPYNLDKNFNGKKFKKTSDEMYEEYTESWIKSVLNKPASRSVLILWLISQRYKGDNYDKTAALYLYGTRRDMGGN